MLVEVMVVVALVGVLTAMAVWDIRGWATSSAHKGAAHQIQSVMRTTQQRAITEGKPYCVLFLPADRYEVYQGACTALGPKRSGPFGTGSAHVHLKRPAFAFMDSLGTPQKGAGVTFTPRGSAWPGDVSVERDNSKVSYVVLVEGMTGRVSLG